MWTRRDVDVCVVSSAQHTLTLTLTPGSSMSNGSHARRVPPGVIGLSPANLRACVFEKNIHAVLDSKALHQQKQHGV